MTEARWAEVKALFQAAVERPPSERAEFLTAATGGDERLRKEVESLLRSDDPDAALTNQLQAGVASLSAMSVGSRLGSYEILSALGAGGMGEVYRARDTRLGRDVAIKILPQAFFADAERVARFQREAKILASLNHPHIAAVYGLHDEGDGVRALVMELVEGDDLAQRVKRGPMPLDEALPIANQIAEALEAAHAQGIIHRDLKPANIKLRRDGTVKVLDFGLAKAVASDGETPHLFDSPTVTAVATRAGTILGTASYMSPEQAKGRAVDRRADLWAFGAVLYELLTGTRAFQGESVTETLSHVLTQAPDWTLLPAGTPAPIRTLLRRCLEKNPTRRLDSAAALRLEIDDALASPAGVAPAGAPQTRRRSVTWVVAVAAVVVTNSISSLGTCAVVRKESPTPALPARFALTFPHTEPLTLEPEGRDFAFSPDGRYLAYQSRGRLMLRTIDQLDSELLSHVSAGTTPFFDPESKWIGFFDGGDLKKVAVTGQPVIPLCRNLEAPEGGTWGDDGTIVVSSLDNKIGLRRVSADGGEATPLTKTDGAYQRHQGPSMLPGGRGVLFTIRRQTLEDRELAVFDFKSGQQKTLVQGAGYGVYLETGHLLYAILSDQQLVGTLWIDGFDLDRLALRGQPTRVSDPMQFDVLDGINYAVSKTGALAYVPVRSQAKSFVWVDRAGHETAIDGLLPDAYVTMGLSPDETRLVFSIAGRGFDIWTWDFARGSLAQVTRGPYQEFLARWTRDGRIIFNSTRDGQFNLYRVAADGSGPVERLAPSKNEQWPNSITPDGTALLFAEALSKSGYDISRLPLAAGQGAGTAAPSGDRLPQSTSLVSGSADEYEAKISPDGRYFAYRSNESGRFEVYVRLYTDPSRWWKISTGGGVAPVWAREGNELFYLDATSTLVAVPVQTSGREPVVGEPAKVFPTNTKYWGSFYSYDVTKDGRFLMMKESNAGGSGEARIVVVLNWFEELKGLLPPR